MTATNRHGLPYEPHHAHPKPSDCHDQTASVRYRYAYSQFLYLNPNVGVAGDYLPISKLYKKKKVLMKHHQIIRMYQIQFY